MQRPRGSGAPGVTSRASANRHTVLWGQTEAERVRGALTADTASPALGTLQGLRPRVHGFHMWGRVSNAQVARVVILVQFSLFSLRLIGATCPEGPRLVGDKRDSAPSHVAWACVLSFLPWAVSGGAAPRRLAGHPHLHAGAAQQRPRHVRPQNPLMVPPAGPPHTTWCEFSRPWPWHRRPRAMSRHAEDSRHWSRFGPRVYNETLPAHHFQLTQHFGSHEEPSHTGWLVNACSGRVSGTAVSLVTLMTEEDSGTHGHWASLRLPPAFTPGLPALCPLLCPQHTLI